MTAAGVATLLVLLATILLADVWPYVALALFVVWPVLLIRWLGEGPRDDGTATLIEGNGFKARIRYSITARPPDPPPMKGGQP